MWVLYLIWILVPYQIYDFQTFSIWYVAFSFCWFLLLYGTFLVWCTPTYLSLLLLPFSIKSKKLFPIPTLWYLPPVFKFYGFRANVQVFNQLWVNLCVWYKMVVQLHSFAYGCPVFQHCLLKRLFFLHFMFFFLIIGVWLIYNAVLVSGVQQSESVMHMHIAILFRFFSHIGYYRILSSFLCYTIGTD